MNPNYHSASQIIRNLSDINSEYEFLQEHGLFRIVRFAPPFFGGSEFWVVNEKGFLWEPAESVEAALAYLKTSEALEYNAAAPKARA